jgi:hypothetical protein
VGGGHLTLCAFFEMCIFSALLDFLHMKIIYISMCYKKVYVVYIHSLYIQYIKKEFS